MRSWSKRGVLEISLQFFKSYRTFEGLRFQIASVFSCFGKLEELEIMTRGIEIGID